MRNRLTLLTAALSLLTLTPLAVGHDLKVLANHLAAGVDDATATVYLSWGHALPVDELVAGATLERYEVVCPTGRPVVLDRDELSLQAREVDLESDGVYQAVAVRKPALLTYVIDAEGNRRMKLGPKSAVKEGKVESSALSQQFAKALLVKGEAAGQVKEVGLPLEVIPLDPPAQWRSGRPLRVRVQFQGKPLAQEQLLASYVGYRPANAWCFATNTDREGVATVLPERAGTWVLRVRVQRLAAGDARAEYDSETYTSTLALEVRP